MHCLVKTLDTKVVIAGFYAGMGSVFINDCNLIDNEMIILFYVWGTTVKTNRIFSIGIDL